MPLADVTLLVPSSPDEALAAFGDGSDVTVVGGGTIVMPDITRAASARPVRCCSPAPGWTGSRAKPDA